MRGLSLNRVTKSIRLVSSTTAVRFLYPQIYVVHVKFLSFKRDENLYRSSHNVFQYSSLSSTSTGDREMPKNPYGSLAFFVGFDWDISEFARKHNEKTGRKHGSREGVDELCKAVSDECDRRQKEVVQLLQQLGFQERHVPSRDRPKNEPAYESLFSLIWVQGASEELRQKIMTIPGVVDTFPDGKGEIIGFVDVKEGRRCGGSRYLLKKLCWVKSGRRRAVKAFHVLEKIYKLGNE